MMQRRVIAALGAVIVLGSALSGASVFASGGAVSSSQLHVQDGRMYVGCDITYSPESPTGSNYCKGVVISSTDGGRSWSAPVEAIGYDQEPAMLAAGYHPKQPAGDTEPCDRPWMRVDQSTG